MSETHFALSLLLGGGPRFVRGFPPSLIVGITTQSVLLVPHFGSHCVHFKYTSVCSLVLFLLLFVLEALGGGRAIFYFIII